MYDDSLSNVIEQKSVITNSISKLTIEATPVNIVSAKRLFDIIGSLLIFVAFGWLYLIIAFAVKISSKGAIIYSHERIGMQEKPFTIYKFRTMYVDAEKNGPALSNKNDPRVTFIGRFLRKTHLDELPQFYNTLIGDMTIIGTRPERKCYIDSIILKVPQYKNVFKNKPGITSWGQINYGYAENIEEMIERFHFDIFYINNMSFKMDLKILLHTIKLMIFGRSENFPTSNHF
jgi:lipopolysaccharide/colanic/teichoic acid biosynthesis glycosyltransferase